MILISRDGNETIMPYAGKEKLTLSMDGDELRVEDEDGHTHVVCVPGYRLCEDGWLRRKESTDA